MKRLALLATHAVAFVFGWYFSVVACLAARARRDKAMGRDPGLSVLEIMRSTWGGQPETVVTQGKEAMDA